MDGYTCDLMAKIILKDMYCFEVDREISASASSIGKNKLPWTLEIPSRQQLLEVSKCQG